MRPNFQEKAQSFQMTPTTLMIIRFAS